MTRLALALLAGLLADPLFAGHPIVLRGHLGTVTAVEFSRDGQTLVSGSADRTARLWSLDGGAQLAIFPDAGLISAVSLSADGALLAVGDAASRVRVFDTRSGAVVRSVSTAEVVTSVSLSPDGRRLAVGGNVNHTLVISVADGKQLLSLDGRALAFSPDGRLLVSGARQPHFSVWNAASLKKLREVSTAPRSPQVALDEKAAHIATWQVLEPGVTIFDAAGRRLAELPRPGESAPAPGDASGARFGRQAPEPKPGEPGAMHRDAPAPGDAPHSARLPGVISASLNADGSLVAVATDDHAVRVYAYATGQVLARFPLDGPGFVALSPDGRWLAVGDGALIKLWALDAGAVP